MRVAVVSLSFALLIACGGTKKPAESANEETSSEANESASGSAGEADGGASEAPAEAEAADAGAPAASASAAPAGGAPAAESAPSHPVPTVTGSIDGKPFAPKMAFITRPMLKDGRVVITIDERTECGGGDPKPGEGVLSITTPWEDGYKADLGSMRGTKKKAGDISFVRIGANGKKESPAAFKPSGRATIVKAPTEENAVGKMNIDMQSGDYMLSGDLDVQLCVAPKAAAAAGKPAKKGRSKK